MPNTNPSSSDTDALTDALNGLQSQVDQQQSALDQLSDSIATLLQQMADLNSRFQASTNLNQQ